MKKRKYRIRYCVFFFLLVTFIGIALTYIYREHYSFETRVLIGQLHDLLSSNIGLPAVIAIAGLVLTAFYDRDDEEKIEKHKFRITVVCYTALGLVIILGIGYMKGVTNMSTEPFGEEYFYSGNQVEDIAEREGQLF